MTTQTENINIIIREDGSRVVQRNMESMGSSAEKVGNKFNALKATIIGVVTGAVLRQIQQMADAFTTIQNRLKLTTNDQGNLNAVFKELNDISTRTRSSLEANVELYGRMSLAAKNLGVSQQEVLQFTESVNKAIKISGASASEAEGGLRQLSQALASGALRGDELNSVMENLPAVADVIGKSLGITRGELRKMGQEGKISGDIILKAFREARVELDEKFAKTAPTIAEGFVLLKNQLINTVGALDAAAGGSSFLGSSLLGIAEALKDVTPQIVGFIRAVTGSLDPMDEMSDTGKAVAAVFVAVYGALKATADLIMGVVIISFKTVGKVIGGVVAAVVAVLNGEFDQAYDIVKQAGSDIGNTFNDESNKAFGNAIDDTSAMFDKLNKIYDKGARDVQDRTKEVMGSVDSQAGPKGKAPGPSEAELAKQEKALERLRNSLRGVLNDIDPLSGAELELARDQQTLVDAYDAGLISLDKYNTYLERTDQYYNDILDPLGKLNRELNEEIGLMKMGSREREVESQVLTATKQLKEQGVILSQKEIEQLREKFTAMQQLNEVMQAQDDLLGQTVEKRKAFIVQLEAIKNLMADSNSGFTGGDAGAAVSSIVSDMGLDPTNLKATLDASEQQFQTMYQQVDMLRQQDLISEQEASNLRLQIWTQEQQAKLENASTFFGYLSQLSKSENKKMAAIGKAAAIAQTTIATYQGAMEAYKSLAGIPYVGPYLGAAAAAAVIAMGAQNIAKIRNENANFATGGSFTVPGSGGVDSQQVAFRATPGEKVTVATPTQVRHGNQMGKQDSAQSSQPVQNRIINLVDKDMLGDYLATPEGQGVLVNTIRRNSDEMRAIFAQG